MPVVRAAVAWWQRPRGAAPRCASALSSWAAPLLPSQRLRRGVLGGGHPAGRPARRALRPLCPRGSLSCITCNSLPFSCSARACQHADCRFCTAPCWAVHSIESHAVYRGPQATARGQGRREPLSAEFEQGEGLLPGLAGAAGIAVMELPQLCAALAACVGPDPAARKAAEDALAQVSPPRAGWPTPPRMRRRPQPAAALQPAPPLDGLLKGGGASAAACHHAGCSQPARAAASSWPLLLRWRPPPAARRACPLRSAERSTSPRPRPCLLAAAQALPRPGGQPAARGPGGERGPGHPPGGGHRLQKRGQARLGGLGWVQGKRGGGEGSLLLLLVCGPFGWGCPVRWRPG